MPWQRKQPISSRRIQRLLRAEELGSCQHFCQLKLIALRPFGVVDYLVIRQLYMTDNGFGSDWYG